MTLDELINDWNGPQAEGRIPILLDETLRDGLQSPSVRDPDIAAKRDLIHRLASLGVDAVDLGMPGAGPKALAAVRALMVEIRDHRLPLRPNWPCAPSRRTWSTGGDPAARGHPPGGRRLPGIQPHPHGRGRMGPRLPGGHGAQGRGLLPPPRRARDDGDRGQHPGPARRAEGHLQRSSRRGRPVHLPLGHLRPCHARGRSAAGALHQGRGRPGSPGEHRLARAQRPGAGRGQCHRRLRGWRGPPPRHHPRHRRALRQRGPGSAHDEPHLMGTRKGDLTDLPALAERVAELCDSRSPPTTRCWAATPSARAPGFMPPPS